MRILSKTYANRLSIVEEFAHFGARPVALATLCRIRPSDARKICRQIQQKGASSGQTPTDHRWFLQTHERRKQGALLLMLLSRFTTFHQCEFPNDYLELGALRAYKTYARLIPQRLVSVERFMVLIGGKFTLRTLAHHSRSNYPEDNIKIMKCRICQIPYLVEDFRLSFICLSCKGKK